MIIRNNLATEPVRNYSLYFLGCVVLAAGTLVFSILNFRSLISWQSESSRLQSNIEEQQARSQNLKNQSSQLRAKITQIKTPQFVKETEFMNNAIKQRTFSWTKLFDEFERIFPNNVKMVSVIPQITAEGTIVNMEVAGKSLDDIIEVITILQNSPAFSNVVFRSERQDSDGSLRAVISLQYNPERVSLDPAPVSRVKEKVTEDSTQPETQEIPEEEEE